MKKINEESEKKLDTIFNFMSQIEVKGENVFRMATSLSLLKEISKQINDEPSEPNSVTEEN